MILACAALLAGCGASNPPSAAPSKATLAKAFQGSPPALMALHRQANELIGGSKSAFDSRLAALRGHPVVVNKWASWCAPCRGEFPVFQRAVLGPSIGNTVAFVGLDGQDNDGDGRAHSLNRPTTKQVDKWKDRLSPDDIASCRRFVEPFGLPYYPDFEPYVTSFRGDGLADVSRAQ